MQAIVLTGFNGVESLRVAEVDEPRPEAGEVLIKVRAAGINYAELEQTLGRYPFQRPLPGIMGFEAAGEVVELGEGVSGLSIGDRVVAPVSSGGYAEYATASAELALPIPEGITFAQATSIVIQGVSAYALLWLTARPKPHETVLIQAAAGGVGLYLVQLAKVMPVGRIIALASSAEKLELVRALGADAAIDYSAEGWPERVLQETRGRGVDVVLEMASGDVGKASFGLLAPFGRFVMYGAKNVQDTFTAAQVRQLIHNNQSIVGFNVPTIERKDVARCVPQLLGLIAQGKIRIFADTAFPLAEVKSAFDALAGRGTIGKVVLVP
ncbi:NADPH:quinone oxidoreductase family protein [bacterium]|nr:MAG: NADPH:quinone oxidoreductase family protein [bacterium]